MLFIEGELREVSIESMVNSDNKFMNVKSVTIIQYHVQSLKEWHVAWCHKISSWFVQKDLLTESITNVYYVSVHDKIVS